MSRGKPTRRLGALSGAPAAAAATLALALAGCASSSIQSSAGLFVEEHSGAATRAAAAAREVDGQVAQLPRSPSAAQLEELARAAAPARRELVQAGEWDVAKAGEGGEEGAEEEDLPRAETEATEAADELAAGMTAVESYARAPRAAALATARGKLARGREQWDESITQLWYLGHRPHPPLV